MTDYNDVKEWVKALKKWFQEAFNVTLSKLQSLKYTVQNAQSHWELSEYVTAIVTAAKKYDQSDTESTQILHTFWDINSELCHFEINELKKRTTV